MENHARSLPPMPPEALRATRSIEKGPDYATPTTEETGSLRGNSGIVRIEEIEGAREKDAEESELNFGFSDFDQPTTEPAKASPRETGSETEPGEKTGVYNIGVLEEQLRKMKKLESNNDEKTGVYDVGVLEEQLRKMKEPEKSGDPVEIFDRDEVLAAAGMRPTTPKDERVETFDRTSVLNKAQEASAAEDEEGEELDDEYLKENMVEVKIPQLNLKDREVTNMSLYNPDGTKKSQTLSREEAHEAMADLELIRNKIANSGK